MNIIDTILVFYTFNVVVSMAPLSSFKSQISVTQMIESCTKQYEKLRERHSALFEHPDIIEIPPKMTFPPMYDIDMDDLNVRIVSTNEIPCLGTTGVATCFAVAGKGITPDNEKFIALAHINLIPPKEVLESMTSAFIQQGCDFQSIEFYIVGGMLPFEGNDGDTDSSFNKEKVFLSLIDEYNIKSVRFNIVKGEIGALTVVMTEEGLFWTMQESSLISTFYDSSEGLEDTSNEDTSSSKDANSSEGTSRSDYSSEESSNSDDINSYERSDSESSTKEKMSLKRKINSDFDDLLTEVKRKNLSSGSDDSEIYPRKAFNC